VLAEICQENILADTHMALIFVVTAVKVVVNEVWVHLSDHCLCERQPVNITVIYRVGQDSAVGMATVRGSNSGGGEIFRTRPDRPWDPPSPPYSVYRVVPGVRTAGASYDAHLDTAPQHIPTQHFMLPQHLVCKYELSCEYCNITLARNKAP